MKKLLLIVLILFSCQSKEDIQKEIKNRNGRDFPDVIMPTYAIVDSVYWWRISYNGGIPMPEPGIPILHIIGKSANYNGEIVEVGRVSEIKYRLKGVRDSTFYFHNEPYEVTIKEPIKIPGDLEWKFRAGDLSLLEPAAKFVQESIEHGYWIEIKSHWEVGLPEELYIDSITNEINRSCTLKK